MVHAAAKAAVAHGSFAIGHPTADCWVRFCNMSTCSPSASSGLVSSALCSCPRALHLTASQPCKRGACARAYAAMYYSHDQPWLSTIRLSGLLF